MKKSIRLAAVVSILTGGLLASAAHADVYYEVTVTNLSKGAVLTPVLVATTPSGESFFTPGGVASAALEIIAESGNSAPLEMSLDAYDSASLGFIEPGQSDSTVVATRGQYRALSVASMVIPTNDTFIALNGVDGPRGNKSVTFWVPAWDAGTELNDELCASLPGPGCGGDPGPASDNGEGHIYISNGIRGVGDIDADLRDWNNPVASITVTRISDD